MLLIDRKGVLVLVRTGPFAVGKMRMIAFGVPVFQNIRIVRRPHQRRKDYSHNCHLAEHAEGH